MIVCMCSDVKDHQIKAAIASGIDTLESLQVTLDVATCCGCCIPMVNDLLIQHSETTELVLDNNLVSQLAYAV